jgi:hypothetical protein
MKQYPLALPVEYKKELWYDLITTPKEEAYHEQAIIYN